MIPAHHGWVHETMDYPVDRLTFMVVAATGVFIITLTIKHFIRRGKQ